MRKAKSSSTGVGLPVLLGRELSTWFFRDKVSKDTVFAPEVAVFIGVAVRRSLESC